MLLNMVMFKVTICDFGKMNINMTDKREKTENGELVTNRDQLVVVDNIESLIKVIRGQQVMLDRDLATLYGVETKRLNEQVKRNIKRFPEDFMFQLTKEECLRSQIATLNEGRGQHLKYMPYVFTEKVHFRLFVTTTFLMSSVLLHAFKLCRCSNWKYKS